jgi:uncharacterized membrane protein
MDPITIGLLIISIALSYALRPRVPKPPAATLADVAIPQIEIGKPIAVAFGEVWVDDSNIIWYGDLSHQPIYNDGSKK